MNSIIRLFGKHLMLFFLMCCFLFQHLQAQISNTKKADIELKFLDEYVVPHKFIFDSTVVGGLSGIDRDPKTGLYYSISDDRSGFNPVRFYTYRINIKGTKIDTVIFQKNTFLKNSDGKYFPPALPGAPTVDPEAMRLWGQQLIWSSEGERIVRQGDTLLLNPAVFLADLDGNYIDTFTLPEQVKVTPHEWGIRQNGGFEGLTISPDQKYLFVSVEEPLWQDGPRAGLGDSTGVVRIIKFDLQTRKPIAQYAYPIEAVVHPVFPPSGFRVNGISDIMCIDDDRLMVIERSYSMGRLTCTIKVFIADLSTADDVSQLGSLKDAPYRMAEKQLVLNMDDLGRFIDNIEGVTFGPVLDNGNRSLIFVADDNFNILEMNQILLFEMAERKNRPAEQDDF